MTGEIKNYPVTYSFLDVDVNSLLSNNLKSRLDKILGDHATETKTTINLNINREGFLKDYFPYFEQLNRQLNSPTNEKSYFETEQKHLTPYRERVEHNTLKLTYRYAVKKSLPFTYIEFLFSEYNKTPLLIRFNFKKDDLNLVETLKQKYGEYREILWKEENGKSLCWQKSGDILIVSFVPDQFGKPTFEVSIFFAKRLEELLLAESMEREAKQKKSSKAGEKIL